MCFSVAPTTWNRAADGSYAARPRWHFETEAELREATAGVDRSLIEVEERSPDDCILC